jgi:hypothetical protein
MQGLSTFTVAEAYSRLASLGYLTAKRGSGHTVANRAVAKSDTAVSRKEATGLTASWLLSDVFADHSIPIKAGCGWLPTEWLNETGLHHAVRSIGRVPATQLSGYGHPYGLVSLRDHIANGLRQYGIPLGVNQVVLTQGVTQGIDLVVRALLRPGDTVAVEDPCYCNLLQILKLADIKAVGVPRTPEGLDIAALEAVAKSASPKAIFVNTALQNPTGSTMSAMCAFKVLQIAERHQMLVVEDDIYRELAPAGTALLAAMDGLDRVIYLSGFSKTITPSLRVGYVAASPDIAEILARTKMAVGLTSSEINERLVYAVLTSGHYARHVAGLSERLASQQERIVGKLIDNGFDIFHRPEGGLFVWAKPSGTIGDVSADQVATLALSKGIWLAPGSYFRPEENDSPWIRFNVATSDHTALWKFFAGLRADQFT